MDELGRLLRDLDGLKPAGTIGAVDIVREALPQRIGLAFLNRYLLDLTVAELADLMRVQPKTVRNYLSAARRGLAAEARPARTRLVAAAQGKGQDRDI